MAYEAARDAGVCPKVLRLFELLCLGTDHLSSWRLSEDRAGTELTFHDSLVTAYDEVLPDMLEAVGESEVNDYVTAPIASEEAWATFVGELPSFEYPCDGAGGYQPEL